ncbi:hypothetical protein [Bifidobacterium aquikefiri]|uniref:hypothetical protein n=1 Tax=Bifidobacterium aquikefiri TaxID=1653207 RepID=UPI0039E98AE8
MSRRCYPRRPARGSLPWLATLVVMAVFAAWQGYGRNLTADSGSAQSTGTSSTVASPSASGSFASAFKAPVSYATALRYARQESVTTPHLQGYSRDSQFGDWQKSSALCGYGTSRDYVLKRDLTNVVMNRYCKVQSGDLQDPYTGESMHFVKGEKTSTLVQIDHIVAVQDAWASGLWRSSRAGERVAYYNDPDVLQAADSTSNEAKGAGMDWDVSSNPVWLPSNTAWHCDYMAKRAYIKRKYNLTMSQGEKTQAVNLLTQCVAK